MNEKVKTRLMEITFIRKIRWILRNLLFLFKRPDSPEENRYSYQKEIINHTFVEGERIIDIGSGGDPFPYAAILAERFLSQSFHRAGEIKTNGKPMVVCDIHHMPFPKNCFDYAVCCHVLEHVDKPVNACAELVRISKAGYIETPRLIKDTLFSWAEFIHHKWYLETIGNRLIFFEYNEKLKKGIESREFHELIFGPFFHPLQKIFNNKQDIFNITFEWIGNFECSVYKQNGDIFSSD